METTVRASLGHQCGVAGIWSASPIDIPSALFFMLFALQHRGQESAGIVWEEDGAHRADRRLGMVSGAADRWLAGGIASGGGIGHVRYSTAGGGGLRNAQPLAVECSKGRVSLAHNGNISNSASLRSALTREGAIFQSSSDSELILHLLSRSRAVGMEAVLRNALAPLEGAYSLCLLWGGTLIAVRDPWGFRPLHIAEKDGVRYVASETCALHTLGPKVSQREILPGEVVILDEEGEHSFFLPAAPRRARCVFELIYFARPDSRVFGESVHAARERFGQALAEADDVKADLVVPVPDSGNLAALGYARRAGIPFEFGITRNHYAGRSFIMPTRAEREFAVRMKLHPVPEIVGGKRVILVDDSLVRGTTSQLIVSLLKEAGAVEVHLRLSAPELTGHCGYGIDIPDRSELISNRMTPDQIASALGADTVRFLNVELLRSRLSEPSEYCYACFDGDYPCPIRNIAGKDS
ncbi:MAG TPA: amidophosphoribosyltransferase [Magnetospirillaceae bacterium]|nr:amidophosphoribosyltransferase [Magnetospirillaceae bacterium]